jgi:hypothetical protein
LSQPWRECKIDASKERSDDIGCRRDRESAGSLVRVRIAAGDVRCRLLPAEAWRRAVEPFTTWVPNTAILQNAITEGLRVRTIRTFYRDHFIDLEEDVTQDGWRVVAIIHSTSKRALSPPVVVSPDDLTAEQHAKEAVDRQIATRLTLDWGDVRRRLFPPNTPPSN